MNDSMHETQQTIAVLGASADHRKFGNKCVRAYHSQGWRVHAVNPHSSTIDGRETVASLDDIDEHLDRISVYLPPTLTLDLIPQIAAADADEVWFNPGSADRRVLAAAERAGIQVVTACSIVAIGVSPADFP